MHSISDESMRLQITAALNRYGISITEHGQIYYNSSATPRLNCKALYLLRHAETLGTQENKFMSNTSANSQLTEQGILIVQQTASELCSLKPDYILYSTIPRVYQTVQVIQDYLRHQSKVSGITYKNRFVEVSWMTGIDNAGWEEKNCLELTGEDAEDFYQREILHNVFARSSNGCCWAQVLFRCIELIEYINTNFSGQRVLLVSQGSVMIGLQIILHRNSDPWKSYNPEEFFGLKSGGTSNYGRLQQIFVL